MTLGITGHLLTAFPAYPYLGLDGPAALSLFTHHACSPRMHLRCKGPANYLIHAFGMYIHNDACPPREGNLTSSGTQGSLSGRLSVFLGQLHLSLRARQACTGP